jgi:hypothetical protein
MKLVVVFLLVLGLILSSPAFGQDFKGWERQIAQYKQWLDSLGPSGVRFWVRVDGTRRPHRLYVDKRFFQADPPIQAEFVETFSTYLAGHPEKSVLIDLYDASTERWVGEYGWGGFKMYPQAVKTLQQAWMAAEPKR